MRCCTFRFILEPLIIKNDLYSFSFYKNMIERMKNQKDALKPDDTTMNYVKWNSVPSIFFQAFGEITSFIFLYVLEIMGAV